MASQTPPLVALVVEDNLLVRCAIVSELKMRGWTVHEASTGERAIAVLSDRHVDVVFTDIQLAGHLTGWDVAEASRAIQPDLPIVYASGNPGDRSRQVKGSQFFDKPYEPAQIVAAFSRIMTS